MDMVLETDQLGKRHGDKWALRDCSLHLPAGRVAALVGPNGAGKSTLLLPAMAATLAGFTVLRIPLTILTRPRYLPAEELTYPIQGVTVQPNPVRGDWLLASGVRNAEGKMVEANAEIACPPGPEGPGAAGCGSDLGLGPGAYNWRLYQPADRFWLFQAIETGIFVALAVLLVYLAIRRVRRIA